MSRVIIAAPMTVDSPLQSFDEVFDWLNRTPKPRENKGHPTLVHFWSISSEESQINLAQTAELRDQRKREGVRVIAVHIPLNEGDKDKRLLRDAILRFNLTEPCALDNDHQVRTAFEHNADSLPAYYLFDIDGRLRTVSKNANGFDRVEDELDQLLEDLRSVNPFCPMCELYLEKDAMFCSECGIPLILPGSKTHPYYEYQHSASLPTIRLVNPDPLIGHLIDGKYELTARLGEGGMSVVYRARRKHIGDEVAVKIMQRRFVSDEAALTRFRREARAAAMLHHPNVITIHDFGETGDDKAPAYIVMEFVKGTPLRDLLSTDHLSIERASRLMRGICAGVGAAHRQGVVHRDLKPENIIVLAPHEGEKYESVRVLDFGLAKLLADAHTGTVVGTPYYMSPDQCLGETLDPRSDVYSLGAVFYEMLSGRRPFVAETVSGNVNKHLYEDPPPLPEELNIPRRIAAAIMRALAKNPDDRPQNATEFARQLQLI